MECSGRLAGRCADAWTVSGATFRLLCLRFAGLYDVCGLTVPAGADGASAPVSATGDVAQCIGIDCLHAADHHVHLVEEAYGAGWHVGPCTHLRFPSACPRCESDCVAMHCVCGGGGGAGRSPCKHRPWKLPWSLAPAPCHFAPPPGRLRRHSAGSDMSQLRVEEGVDVAKGWLVTVDLETLTAEVALLLVVAPGVEAEADAAVRAARDGEDAPALLAQLLERLGPVGVGLFQADLERVLVGPGPVAAAASPAAVAAAAAAVDAGLPVGPGGPADSSPAPAPH